MALWVVRAGKHGEDENAALTKGLAIIGWHEMPDVSTIRSYEAMKEKHAEVYPDMSPKAIVNNAAQLWAFSSKIAKDDLAVLPLKTRSAIAIGKVVGDYKYLDGRHTRSVQWIKDDLPRPKFGQDLLHSFGAYMTVCHVTRNNAEERVKSVLAGNGDPHLLAKRVPLKGIASAELAADEDDGMVDLEEQAFDQIRLLIQSRFSPHLTAPAHMSPRNVDRTPRWKRGAKEPCE